MNFDDFLRWYNINLRIENIPCYIHGFAYYNGIEYLVIINRKNSCEQSQQTTIHELIHIFENHFSCKKGYENRCEKEVDIIIRKLKNKEFEFV